MERALIPVEELFPAMKSLTPYFFCLTPNISHDGSRAQKGFIGQM